MKQLDLRAFELKSDVHDVFDHVWKSLVQTDMDASTFAIYDALAGKPHHESALALADIRQKNI